jgi:hypothetical protein
MENFDFSKFMTNDPKKTVPKFYEGVLFTGGWDKAGVLSPFLDQCQTQPELVVMFDDLLENLLQIEEMLKTRHIPFIGYHYRAIDRIQSDQHVNKSVQDLQIQTLIEKLRWLSDEEANLVLQN